MKTLFVGLCLLLLATQSTAAANGDSTQLPAGARASASGGATSNQQTLSLERRLQLKRDVAGKYRSVVRFFKRHPKLLTSSEHRATAQRALDRAKRRLARATQTIASIRRILQRRETRRLAIVSPRVAICDVFGRRYCGQALAVAWCESRHSTTARNGQYLGLFQMGAYERRLFGHGPTARQQALAAHHYFLLSGRDWSPWGCKPWFAV
jgi:hypothetical protein